MAKSHKTFMEQAEIIDTFSTYQSSSSLIRRRTTSSGAGSLRTNCGPCERHQRRSGSTTRPGFLAKRRTPETTSQCHPTEPSPGHCASRQELPEREGNEDAGPAFSLMKLIKLQLKSSQYLHVNSY